MRQYIVRRLLLIIPIMLGVSFLTFATFHFLIAGNVVDILCGLTCDAETKLAIEHEYGLDRPWYEQYSDWLLDAAQGDFGTSYLTKLPLTTELERRLPVTLELMVLALVLSLVLGIPPGILSAIRPATPLDWLARFSSVLWLSIPSFYLGILVILFGANWFGWSPPNFATGKAVGFFDDPLTNLETFFFPSLVLALGTSAVIMRLTRSSMLEVMRNDYIRTAWSKGLRERSVVGRHALKNAMIPVLTIIGLQVGGLIGGSVIIETVFGLNGMGSYLLVSIIGRDILVVQSLVLMFAVIYVVINLLVDLGYAWLDPRIHYA